MAVVPGDGDTAGEQQHQRRRDVGSERRGGEPDDGVSAAGGTILDIVDPPTRLVAVGG